MLDRLVRRRPDAHSNVPVDAPVVLLIDDDEEEVILLGDLLARVPGAQYRLESVATAEGALERLSLGGYAVALLDVRLGAANGLDVLRQAMVAGCRVPIVMLTGERDPSLDRAALELGAVDFLSKGRSEPAALERTLRYAIAHGEAMEAVRRSEQRTSAIEEVSRLVGEQGIDPEVLERVVAILGERLGFRFVSVYLAEGGGFRLGSQVGHQAAVPMLEVSGALTQVLRTRRPTFVPNMTVDPDHRGGGEPGQELCLPLVAGTEIPGLLLVGSSDHAPIGEADHATLMSVADRLASALVLAQDRREVASRALRFRRLSRFAATLNAVTDSSTFDAVLAKAAAEVVSADMVALAVRQPGGDRFIVRSAHGPDAPSGGSVLELWAPAQRALESERVVLEQVGDRWCSAIPLIRHGRVIGLLLVERDGRPYDVLEREAFPLMGDQVGLALASWLLDAGETIAAVRDHTTGLFTEAYARAALAQLLSARRRTPLPDRRPAAALIFGLDSAAGPDELDPEALSAAMKELSDRLLARLRASDLIWRTGHRVAAILPDASRGQAAAIAEQMLHGAMEVPGDGPATITLSAGCASLDDEGEDPLSAAEAALMMARRAGGGALVQA